MIWVLIGPSCSFSPLCCLAFAACFPGMVYNYALFPVSLLTFLSVVCLLLFIRRHYLWAGVVGALCAWAFAIGPLIGVVLLVAALVVDRGPGFWRIAVKTAGVTFAGFAAWLFVNQLWVGDLACVLHGPGEVRQRAARSDRGLHHRFHRRVVGSVPAPGSESRVRLSDPQGSVGVHRRTGYRPGGVDLATLAGEPDRFGAPQFHGHLLALTTGRRANLEPVPAWRLFLFLVSPCVRGCRASSR